MKDPRTIRLTKYVIVSGIPFVTGWGLILADVVEIGAGLIALAIGLAIVGIVTDLLKGGK